jgi:hypothetical protein
VDLAGVDREIETVQRGGVAESFVEVADEDRRCEGGFRHDDSRVSSSTRASARALRYHRGPTRLPGSPTDSVVLTGGEGNFSRS